MFRAANVFSKVVSIIVALMFLVIGLIFFLKFDPDAYDMECTGTIVEINEYYEHVGGDNQLMHDVFIDYTAGGQRFEHVAFFEYNGDMEVGDTVSFYYMSEDPSQIAGANKGSTPYIGLGISVLGLVMLVVTGVKILRKTPM